MFPVFCSNEAALLGDTDMKMISALLAAASMVMGTQAASAATYSPAGTHVLSGTVGVQKDGLRYNCTLTATLNIPEAAPDAHGSASHGHSATITSIALSGAFPCGSIGVSGTPLPVSVTGTSPANLTVTIGSGLNPISIIPPVSLGTCVGTLSATWNGTNLIFSSPLSNVTKTGGLNDCRITGSISGGGLTITNP